MNHKDYKNYNSYKLYILAGCIVTVGFLTAVYRSFLQPKHIISPLPSDISASVYAPSQYLSLSQSSFNQAKIFSQKRDQNPQDKQEIINQLQQALDIISEGITKYPNDSQLWAYRTDIYLAVSKYSAQSLNEAENDLTTASRLDPGNVDLLAKLKELQVQTGHLNAASHSLDALLSQTSDPPKFNELKREKETLDKLIAQSGGNFDTTKTINTSAVSTAKLVSLSTNHSDVIVADATVANSPYANLIGSSAFSDTATLTAGAKTVTVENTKVSADSPIYLAPIDNKSVTLTLISKTTGSHFVVSVDKPLDKPLTLRYWIMNK